MAGGFILFRPRDAGASRSAAAEGEPPKTPNVGRRLLPGAPRRRRDSPGRSELAKLRESFERKDYGETVRLAESILSEDPGQAEAREFRIKAKAELDAAQAAARLKTGIASYESGNYAACVKEMEEVLRLDENNQERETISSRPTRPFRSGTSWP